MISIRKDCFITCRYANMVEWRVQPVFVCVCLFICIGILLMGLRELLFCLVSLKVFLSLAGTSTESLWGPGGAGLVFLVQSSGYSSPSLCSCQTTACSDLFFFFSQARRRKATTTAISELLHWLLVCSFFFSFSGKSGWDHSFQCILFLNLPLIQTFSV